MSTRPCYQLWDIEKDPVGTYETMRARGPVFWDARYHTWFVTDYQLGEAVLKNANASAMTTHLLQASVYPPQAQPLLTPLIALLKQWPLFQEGETHRQQRQLAQRHLQTGALAHLLEQIPAQTDQRLAHAGSCFDFMEAIARPTPIATIAALLGLPVSDYPLFQRWSDSLAEMFFSQIKLAPQIKIATEYLAEALDYFDRLGPPYAEAPATYLMLLITGIETSQALIGNAFYQLMQHPAERDKLSKDPDLIHQAIDSALRFHAPIQSILRVAQAPLSIGSAQVKTGEAIRLMVGAMHQDPRYYHQPLRFSIDPQNQTHLAFGSGVHFCLGQQVIRQTAATLIMHLTTRATRWQLSDTPPPIAHTLSSSKVQRLLITRDS